MNSFVLLALLGTSSAITLNDIFDNNQEDIQFDTEKHSYFTALSGKTYDLAQHGKMVTDDQFDTSLVQESDNFDNGFEDIDISQEKKKSHYFLGQNGRTYDLANGHQTELRSESYIRGDDNLVQTSDWYDRDLPEDAFKAEPKKSAVNLKKATPGNGSGFAYDPVSGLPILAGMSADADGQIDYDNMVQLNKETTKATPSFGYDHVTGLPVVFGDPIDFDHDFVQFSGEPINKVLATRNLLQVSDDWMAA
jgi:hypothetical protein